MNRAHSYPSRDKCQESAVLCALQLCPQNLSNLSPIAPMMLQAHCAPAAFQHRASLAAQNEDLKLSHHGDTLQVHCARLCNRSGTALYIWQVPCEKGDT